MKRRFFLALAANALARRVFALPVQTADSTVRFIAFGDSGTGRKEQYALGETMLRHWQQQAFDTVLLLGDNLYPNGSLSSVAKKFERPYASLLRNGVQFRAVLGNHDVRKGRAAQLNYANFGMQGSAYYSFTKGQLASASESKSAKPLVEFFALDSTAFDAKQQSWCEAALAESEARWKVAYFHHSLYSSARRHGSDLALRRALEPLLLKHHVDVVLSGHDHVYERTKPQHGVQYFVAGSAGRLRRGDLNWRSPFLAAGNDERGCFLSLTVTPDQFHFAAINATGQVVDAGALAWLPHAMTSP